MQVSLDKMKNKNLLITLMWLFLIVGIICFITGLFKMVSTVTFKNSAEKTTGIISEINVETVRSGNETKLEHTVIVAYDANGELFTTPIGSYSSSMNEGDPIELYFSTKNPSDCRYISSTSSYVISLLIPAILAGVAFFVLFALKRKPKPDISLLENSDPNSQCMTDLEPKSAASNKLDTPKPAEEIAAKKSGNGEIILMGILFVVLGAAALIFSLVLMNQHTQFMKTAIETNATITNITSTRRTNNSSSHTKRKHTVYISYEVDGKEYDTTLKHFNSSMDVGDEVPVYYNPKNPEKIQGMSSNFVEYLFAGVSILFIVIGILILFFTLKKKKIPA
ncbi:MAG: DUF3592 domain-containing protein [Oscillospiraceae bacterium]